MGVCKLGIQSDNSVVVHSPSSCFGGLGKPPCRYLHQCMKENNICPICLKPTIKPLGIAYYCSNPLCNNYRILKHLEDIYFTKTE